MQYHRMKLLCTDSERISYALENQGFSLSRYMGLPTVDLDMSKSVCDVLGFGISMTDASAYTISRMPEKQQDVLLQDLFTPVGLNLSIIRLNVGSSDYSTEVYSYDEVADDMELKHFSIARDMDYLIPLLKKIKTINPELFFFSSPWSPPSWMKTSNSICGGYMLRKYLPVFADYYVKYLQAYKENGIEINAITMQNEPDTHQYGQMPQSFLHPEYEAELVGKLMPPRLKAAGLTTKLWLHDHNFIELERVLFMLKQPGVFLNTDSVAMHPYRGEPCLMKAISAKYPKMKFQLTEKGPNLRKDSAESSYLWWSKLIADSMNCGCSSFTGWNCALDEKGCPNLGPFDCAGLVEVHSQTHNITPSAQYHAFRHLSPYMKRGGKILNCPVDFEFSSDIKMLVCQNPDGTHVVFASNSKTRSTSLQLKWHGEYLRLLIPGQAMVTALF